MPLSAETIVGILAVIVALPPVVLLMRRVYRDRIAQDDLRSYVESRSDIERGILGMEHE
jgi:hypothetical protein